MPKAKLDAEAKLEEIHKVFNEEDDSPEGLQDTVKRIRAILYGDPLPPSDPWDDEEKNEP